MPQSKARKLEYNRDRQRKLRAWASLKLASAPNSPTPLMLSPQIQKHRNVVPPLVLDVVPPRRQKPYSQALARGMSWAEIQEAGSLELKAEMKRQARRRKSSAQIEADYYRDLNHRGLSLTPEPFQRFVDMATGEILASAPRTQEKPQKAIHDIRATYAAIIEDIEALKAEIRRLEKGQVLLEAEQALHMATAHSNAGGLYYGEKGDSI